MSKFCYGNKYMVIVIVFFTLYLPTDTIPAELNNQNLSLFQSNMQRTGEYKDKNIKNPSHINWKFTSEGDTRLSIIIYYKNMVYCAKDSGTIFAIDSKTGIEKWRFQTSKHRNTISNYPMIWKDILYFGDHQGFFYALNAINGKEIWKANNLGRIVTSPLISNGIICFGCYKNDRSRQNKDLRIIYGLDAKTGTIKWKFEHNADINQVPAAFQNSIYFTTFRNGKAFALDTQTGQLKWKSPQNYTVFSPVVYKKVIYAAGHSGFHAVDLASGKELWNIKQPFQSTPAIANDIAYLYGPFQSGIIAIHLKEKKELWRIKCDSGSHYFPPVIVNGLLYVTTYGKITVIDLSKHTILSSFTTKNEISSPVFNDGLMFVGSVNGTVYAISEKRPKEKRPFIEKAFKGTETKKILSSIVDYNDSIKKNNNSLENKLEFMNNTRKLHSYFFQIKIDSYRNSKAADYWTLLGSMYFSKDEKQLYQKALSAAQDLNRRANLIYDDNSKANNEVEVIYKKIRSNIEEYQKEISAVVFDNFGASKFPMKNYLNESCRYDYNNEDVGRLTPLSILWHILKEKDLIKVKYEWIKIDEQKFLLFLKGKKNGEKKILQLEFYYNEHNNVNYLYRLSIDKKIVDEKILEKLLNN